MTLTKARAVYHTELSGEVFGEMLDGVHYVKALCPDIDPSLADDLVEAAEKYGWGRVKDYDEHMLFMQQYMQIKQQVYREAGLAAFELYDRYQKIVEAAVLKITNWGDITGDFMGHLARAGTEQWMMRQMSTDTFFDATPAQCVTSASIFEAMALNAQILVPRNALGGTCHTYNDEQMYLIFYYRNDLNPRVIDWVQETVTDDWGVRPPMDVYGQMQKGNMGIVTRPGCLVVDDNQDYDVMGYGLAVAEHDFMPQGIDLITRNQCNDI